MNQLIVLGVIWSWHVFWMLMTAYAIGRAAYTHSGWPIARVQSCKIGLVRCKFLVVKWPVSGRWLLSFLFLSWVIVTADVALAIWKSVYNDIPPRSPIDWRTVMFRVPPMLFGPWVFWRQWRRGLTNDPV